MKHYLLLASLIFCAQTHATHFLSPNTDVLSIQSCEYRKTLGPHDFSLLNRGFFVVSNEKRTKLRFTRYGEPMISYEGYMTDIYGNRYQGINPKNSQLSDIQFSFDRLKPRATDSIKLTLNLDNTEAQRFLTRLTVYDAEEQVHDAAFLFKALTKDSQRLEITIDGQSVYTTIAHFDAQSKIKLSNQFIPFQFSINNKTQDIILNLKGTTARPQQGSVLKMQQNGYPGAVGRQAIKDFVNVNKVTYEGFRGYGTLTVNDEQHSITPFGITIDMMLAFCKIDLSLPEPDSAPSTSYSM